MVLRPFTRRSTPGGMIRVVVRIVISVICPSVIIALGIVGTLLGLLIKIPNSALARVVAMGDLWLLHVIVVIAVLLL